MPTESSGTVPCDIIPRISKLAPLSRSKSSTLAPLRVGRILELAELDSWIVGNAPPLRSGTPLVRHLQVCHCYLCTCESRSLWHQNIQLSSHFCSLATNFRHWSEGIDLPPGFEEIRLQHGYDAQQGSLKAPEGAPLRAQKQNQQLRVQAHRSQDRQDIRRPGG